MGTKIYNITTKDGSKAQLFSDEALTLAFGRGFDDQGESTPEDLAECVSRQSLLRIFEQNENRSFNDMSKALHALLCSIAFTPLDEAEREEILGA
jgi:hypothetical protein